MSGLLVIPGGQRRPPEMSDSTVPSRIAFEGARPEPSGRVAIRAERNPEQDTDDKTAKKGFPHRYLPSGPRSVPRSPR
jgi:hypothetical protein